MLLRLSHETEAPFLRQGCQKKCWGAVSEAGGVLIPGAGLCVAPSIFCDGESPLCSSARQQQLAGCRPVLLRNEVVQDRVDGCAQVEKLQGKYIKVLGEQHRPHVPGVDKYDPANVERQPANYKGQNHHSYKTK